jgi:nucleotide-binding universal stress UspA family protein
MFLDHVLIPLSGSEAADELLDWAKSIVHSEGKVSLVRIINEPTHTGHRTTLTTKDMIVGGGDSQGKFQEALIYLEHLAETIKESGVNDIRLHVKTGNPATVIVDIAKDSEADIIIMSTRDRSGFHQWLLESVAITILRKAHCPVLILRTCVEKEVS